TRGALAALPILAPAEIDVGAASAVGWVWRDATGPRGQVATLRDGYLWPLGYRDGDECQQQAASIHTLSSLDDIGGPGRPPSPPSPPTLGTPRRSRGAPRQRFHLITQAARSAATYSAVVVTQPKNRWTFSTVASCSQGGPEARLQSANHSGKYSRKNASRSVDSTHTLLATPVKTSVRTSRSRKSASRFVP